MLILLADWASSASESFSCSCKARASFFSLARWGHTFWTLKNSKSFSWPTPQNHYRKMSLASPNGRPEHETGTIAQHNLWREVESLEMFGLTGGGRDRDLLWSSMVCCPSISSVNSPVPPVLSPSVSPSISLSRCDIVLQNVSCSAGLVGLTNTLSRETAGASVRTQNVCCPSISSVNSPVPPVLSPSVSPSISLSRCTV
jgi:hypothetical protein